MYSSNFSLYSILVAAVVWGAQYRSRLSSSMTFLFITTYIASHNIITFSHIRRLRITTENMSCGLNTTGGWSWWIKYLFCEKITPNINFWWATAEIHYVAIRGWRSWFCYRVFQILFFTLVSNFTGILRNNLSSYFSLQQINQIIWLKNLK